MFVDNESGRVLRGGSFTDRMVVARSGERNVRPPGDRTVQYGFRLARTLPAMEAVAPGKRDSDVKPQHGGTR
jgi:hypothetical protein